jgi:hypothetical protein
MTSKGEPRSGKGEPRSGIARGGAAAESAPVSGASKLSRLVDVNDIPEGGLQVPVQADAAERAGVAKRAGLLAVHLLEADLAITRLDETKLRVAGPLRARVAETCVVSLDPFETGIDAGIEADFVPEARRSVPRRAGSARRPQPVDDASSSFTAQLNAPDPIIDGRIDLGALVEEFLILNLDPYPRKPGVRFHGGEFSIAPDETASPFSVLKKLTGKD